MSADLLEAFGNTSLSNQPGKQQTSTYGPADVQALQPRDDDTWQPWPAQTQTTKVTKSHGQQTLWKADPRGNDVLFDADELDDPIDTLTALDEFGDFEQARGDGTEPQEHVSPQTANAGKTLLDLSDFDENVAATDTTSDNNGSIIKGQQQFQAQSITDTEAGKGATFLVDADDDWGGFEDVEHTANTNSQPLVSHVKKPKVEDIVDADFDAWDDFEDGPSNGQTLHTGSMQKTPAPSRAAPATTKQDRPVNVPPPAVILALITKALFRLSSSSHQSDIADVQVGTVALQAYRVSARVIAGRTLRWKRDTVLSQSMRIGVAGRSGGMKLTSINKGQSRKEEQESEEVVVSWSRFSHTLNAAMVKARLQKPPMSLSTNIAVRTGTGAGVLQAPQICPLCGLKRNERINGIDTGVSDTFGEFWIEHWGHKDCHDFWYQHKGFLEQR